MNRTTVAKSARLLRLIEALGAHRSPTLRFRQARFAIAWGLPPVAWQAAFFVGPLLLLVWISFWSVVNFRLTPDFVLDNWRHLLGSGSFINAYAYSFKMAVLTAVTVGAVAIPAAYTIAFKTSPRLRLTLLLLLIVPFFTSYPVRIYSWQSLLSPNGFINSMLDLVALGPYLFLNNWIGTLVGLVTLTMPLVVIIQTLAFSAVDRSYVEAAHNLGCGRIKTFFTVLLPLARTGLILSVTLAFVLAFGDFISPTFLGGSRPPTLSILLTDQVQSGNHWPRAAVVAVIMFVTLITVVLSMLAFAYRNKWRSV
ncbi:ABC transporter permease [Aquisalimonas asiatica]|uniref:Spermidine/putrescine transport system permease protein n=1 Tax=Aquisalimonas asiatica TaxID=406100 RepID=A0A1H8RHD6_9GAMM|nr:ABC transporter permease [Aquisalimonas asiatica]SEO65949.1 spermidine/putrescine transport system permease protein [Aquisalimonas asiatica]